MRSRCALGQNAPAPLRSARPNFPDRQGVVRRAAADGSGLGLAREPKRCLSPGRLRHRADEDPDLAAAVDDVTLDAAPRRP
jgi:hypothetical protein